MADTGDDELGELAKNGEVINLKANCGDKCFAGRIYFNTFEIFALSRMSPLALQKLYYPFF